MAIIYLKCTGAVVQALTFVDDLVMLRTGFVKVWGFGDFRSAAHQGQGSRLRGVQIFRFAMAAWAAEVEGSWD